MTTTPAPGNHPQRPPLRHTPLVLIIRDGWGENPHPEHHDFNAIELADTPVADRLMAEYINILIHTSGEDVGVPAGTTGNSEVGHQNIGAGRIVNQDSVRITKAIREGDFFRNRELVQAARHAKEHHTRLHLMGICSDAGVHGRLEHLEACIELARREGLGPEQLCVHLFTDGRDTGPFTGMHYAGEVEAMLRKAAIGRIASVIGRYWAMDRDSRWERVERAYRCLTGGNAKQAGVSVARTAREGIQGYYDHPRSENEKGDEFVTPTMIGADEGEALKWRIGDGDAVIFYNYRGDRPRELVRAFVLDDFFGAQKPSPDTGLKGFDRGPRLKVHFVTMCEYDKSLSEYVHIAFPKPPKLKDIAGDYFSRLKLTQFRCAETEKYPHVTFFFNDYREEPFEGEKRQIIQSPKVATYDQKPEMSARGVCDAVLARLNADDCEDVIIVNFANTDMVGHTGNLKAAIRAAEVVDGCVGEIVEAAMRRNGALIVTADHGNAEQMWDPEHNSPHTSHTMYDVPLIIVGRDYAKKNDAAVRLRQGGRLADIMPTLLQMLELGQPEAMTGGSLLVRE